ncbi:MAG: XrtA-associated tyrosine autokinase [Candidatus Competibacteraceae bacterium]
MNSIERAMERLNREQDKVYKREIAIPFPVPVGDKAGPEPRAASAKKTSLELNFRALARAGYLTPATMHGDLAEEYRLLKRPLLLNANAEGNEKLEYGNLIAVTSALPNEGKTFTAFNLAMSIAMELDKTVLLVDSDLIRRSLTHLVGLDKALGLTDVLLDPHLDLGDVIVNTNIPKLRLIPAGRTHRHTTELLASEQMQILTAELSARYDDRIVLFDTPPVLTTSQASVLAALMGQILMVVAEGKTSQYAIEDAIERLDVDEDKVIGMVLNRCRHSSSRDVYGDYYYSAS